MRQAADKWDQYFTMNTLRLTKKVTSSGESLDWAPGASLLRPHSIFLAPVQMKTTNHCQEPSGRSWVAFPSQVPGLPLSISPPSSLQVSFSWMFLFVPSCSAPVHTNWKMINSQPHASPILQNSDNAAVPFDHQTATVLDSWTPLFEFSAAKVSSGKWIKLP